MSHISIMVKEHLRMSPHSPPDSGSRVIIVRAKTDAREEIKQGHFFKHVGRIHCIFLLSASLVLVESPIFIYG